MPSREPFETTIATFSIVVGSVSATSGWSRVYVIISCSFLDAALRLGDAADLGGELRRTLGKELVELLDGDSGLLAERTNRRRGARREEPLPHEVDDEPVPGRQLRDPVRPRDLG